jgi:hypothetical protein
MKDYSNVVIALVLLAISMFCGFICIAAGLGEFFPPLEQVAAPIVCGDQRLEIDQHHYSGGRVDITAYCVDSDFVKKQDVTGPVKLVTGTIYSLVFFVIALIVFVRYFLLDTNSATEAGQTIPKRTRSAKTKPSESGDESQTMR